MEIKYQFFTTVKIWYQFFTSVKNWYHFFTSVSIWFWFFTFVKIEYQFFTGVKNWYQFFTFVKIEYQFFTAEKNRTSPSQMARMRTYSSQLKMRKMWNLSTDVRPPKLSKLTIGKYHIFQKWRIGTNSSHDVKFAKCEICGSARLLIKSICPVWAHPLLRKKWQIPKWNAAKCYIKSTFYDVKSACKQHRKQLVQG